MSTYTVAWEAEWDEKYFEIIPDKPEVGFYLFRYNSARFPTHDYLQDSIPMCQRFALEEWDVPLDRWVPAERDPYYVRPMKSREVVSSQGADRRSERAPLSAFFRWVKFWQ